MPNFEYNRIIPRITNRQGKTLIERFKDAKSKRKIVGKEKLAP